MVQLVGLHRAVCHLLELLLQLVAALLLQLQRDQRLRLVVVGLARLAALVPGTRAGFFPRPRAAAAQRSGATTSTAGPHCAAHVAAIQLGRILVGTHRAVPGAGCGRGCGRMHRRRSNGAGRRRRSGVWRPFAGTHATGECARLVDVGAHGAGPLGLAGAGQLELARVLEPRTRLLGGRWRRRRGARLGGETFAAAALPAQLAQLATQSVHQRPLQAELFAEARVLIPDARARLLQAQKLHAGAQHGQVDRQAGERRLDLSADRQTTDSALDGAVARVVVEAHQHAAGVLGGQHHDAALADRSCIRARLAAVADARSHAQPIQVTPEECERGRGQMQRRWRGCGDAPARQQLRQRGERRREQREQRLAPQRHVEEKAQQHDQLGGLVATHADRVYVHLLGRIEEQAAEQKEESARQRGAELGAVEGALAHRLVEHLQRRKRVGAGQQHAQQPEAERLLAG
mmetsp:Transcript_14703/g.44135  ORF Transcript_14703/g.44135 Transcript_14703/m.44135 type:complete len:460 (+) Transcript_14703:4870-6249(+)